MSNLYVRAFYEREAAEHPEVDGSPMRFTASTEGVARDGLVIAAEGWKLENYRKNPVVLWAHDYLGRNLPIGKAVNVAVEGNRLVADVLFDQADDFARQVERKYRSGFLNAVSVGWETKLIEPGKGGGAARVAEAELLDISGVPVPGDPDALMEREYRSLQEIFGTTNNGDDTHRMNNANMDNAPGDADAEGAWGECAAEMVDVFITAPDEADESRLRRYQALLPKYRRLGKTPPEFRTAEELAGLGPEEVQGLFFHNEIQRDMSARVGAVLNARNRGDLEQAVALIQAVLARAVKEAEEEQAEDRGEQDQDNQPQGDQPEGDQRSPLQGGELELAVRLLKMKFENYSGGLK
jgi:hypothetical protein